MVGGREVQSVAVAPRLAVVTNDSGETEELGCQLGTCLNEPMVVLIEGPLGAGKTVLARGVARGLGFEGYVRSPTFTLIHHYTGRLPIYHLDLYRIEGEGQLEDLGLEEYFYGSGVCLVEWAERLGPERPDSYVYIKVQTDPASPQKRHIMLVGHGTPGEHLVVCVKRALEGGVRPT